MSSRRHRRRLLDFLLKMRFLTRADPVDVTADWALLSLVGPAAGDALARLGVAVPDAPARAAGARAEVRLGRGAPRARPRSTRPPRCRAAAGPGATQDRFDLLVPRAVGTRRAGPAGRPAGRHLGVRGAPGRGAAYPGSGSRPTTGRSRPRSTCWLRRYTWTRGVTAARRRWPGCTTSAGRRAGWCCCTWTGSAPTAAGRRHAGTRGRRAGGRIRRYRRSPPRARHDRAGGGEAERRRRRALLTVGDVNGRPSTRPDDPRHPTRVPQTDRRHMRRSGHDERHVDHGCSHRRGVGEGRGTGAAGDPRRAGHHGPRVRGGRRQRDPRAHPRRRRRSRPSTRAG